MKRLIYTSFSIALLLACLPAAAACAAQGQSVPPDTPVGRRVAELMNLVNSFDRKATEAYVQANYAKAFIDAAPMDAHVGFIARAADMSRGVEFHGLQDATPHNATALFRSKLTGEWIAVIVAVEPNPPHLITGLGARPGKAPGPAAARKVSEADAVRELEAFVQKLADADFFSGTVLLAKDGKPVFAKAYGVANKDFNAPNRVDTKFNLGSMNKMFTAVAIAQLVERGKLSFDDPLAKFLPEFPTKEDAAKIKIKHLLTHTSGLGNYFNQKFMESSRARFRTVDDMMTLVADEKLAFEPGTKWQYSNTGMLVLGAVIEKATGQSYFDYVRENIYKPAGMTNSDSYELDLVNPNLAVGYDKEPTDNGVRYRNNIFMHVIRGGPAGGGYSTVEDLLKFAVALRSNRLVGAEYVKQLLSPKPELSSPDYGYGFQVESDPRVAGHGGGFPGISSNLDMFLDGPYTAVVLANYGGASGPVVNKIRELVVAASQ
jgi:CubicO group peptidase (beta-lactamase class C family)